MSRPDDVTPRPRLDARSTIHAHALRAAAAVTGRARTLGRPALCVAIAAQLTACSGAPLEEQNTSWALQEGQTAASVADQGVDQGRGADMGQPDQSAASCVGDDGTTDWACCARTDRKAAGCAVCKDPYPNEAPTSPACLSCWPLIQSGDDYGKCCQAFSSSFELQQSVGCAPWGPPAPGRWRGHTLDALLARRIARQPARRWRRGSALPVEEVRHDHA